MTLKTTEVNGEEIVDPDQVFMVLTGSKSNWKASEEFSDMLDSIKKLKGMVEEEDEEGSDDIEVYGKRIEGVWGSSEEPMLPFVEAKVMIQGVNSLAEAVDVVEQRLGIYE